MPGYEKAVAYPYVIVYESMLRVIPKVKAANPNIIVRPWIQDFPDYGFDRRIYTPDEVRAQMFASYDSGGGGWLLWDPRIKYTPEALVTSDTLYPPNETGDIMVLRYQILAKTIVPMEQPAAWPVCGKTWNSCGRRLLPVNLRDLAVGNPNLRRDLDARIKSSNLPPVQADELFGRNLYYTPQGKQPVVLTFDGSHISQYRLLPDGTLDPNCALGVLYQFHQEHPATGRCAPPFLCKRRPPTRNTNFSANPTWPSKNCKPWPIGAWRSALIH